MGSRSRINADERVVFFPTVGWREGSGWRVELHGWIYEPVEYSRVRRAALWVAKRAVGRRVGKGFDGAVAKERLGVFFADNERGERVRVRCCGREFAMGRSRADGHFEGEIFLEGGEVEREGVQDDFGRWVRFEAMTRLGDDRVFAGRAMLLGEEGVSVISDIDDTIKVTGVLERRAMLRSTFCEAFACVPGMAEMYGRLRERHGAVFHYVSASPWQLYLFLAENLGAAGFPAGTFHLRRLRLRGRSLVGAFASSLSVKRRHVEGLMERFPRRRFVLVGDSSEQDGELYAGVARKYPRRVMEILILEAGGEKREWGKVFAGVGGWRVFREAGEVG
jgi:hypothetical protein